MTIRIEDIRKFIQFKDLSEQEIESIIKNAKEKTYQKGEKIFKEKTTADTLYLLVKGRVSIRMGGNLSSSTIEVDRISPGATFGWSAIVEPYTYTASAHALTNTKVIAVSADALLNLFEENERIGYLVTKGTAKVIARRLKSLWREMVEEQQNLTFRTRGL